MIEHWLPMLADLMAHVLQQSEREDPTTIGAIWIGAGLAALVSLVIVGLNLWKPLVLGLLVDLAFILHGLVSELHSELIDRHKIDRRWRMERQAFLKRHGLLGDDGQWPI